MPTVQIALPVDDHQRLRRLAARLNVPYRQVVALAIAALDGGPEASTRTQYAKLSEPERAPWRVKALELHQAGLSLAGVGKKLYDLGLCASDGHPLTASTVRGLIASAAVSRRA